MNNMETKKEEAKAQGVEAKKKQAKSVTYALRAIGDHVRTLREAGLIDDGDGVEIDKVLNKAGSKYVASMWK